MGDGYPAPVRRDRTANTHEQEEFAQYSFGSSCLPFYLGLQKRETRGQASNLHKSTPSHGVWSPLALWLRPRSFLPINHGPQLHSHTQIPLLQSWLLPAPTLLFWIRRVRCSKQLLLRKVAWRTGRSSQASIMGMASVEEASVKVQPMPSCPSSKG